MATVNPKATENIDNYLTKVSNEQLAILQLIRKTINGADDRIMEDWKWGVPCFSMEGLICWSASFKSHVGLNFFKGAIIEDSHKSFIENDNEDKGNRMIHYKRIKDVNADIIKDYIKQAIALNEKGIKLDSPKKQLLETPYYFATALKANEAAQKVFDGFTAAQKRDYVEWLVEAKREATRDKRMAQAIEWIAEGKTRNWKYMNC